MRTVPVLAVLLALATSAMEVRAQDRNEATFVFSEDFENLFTAHKLTSHAFGALDGATWEIAPEGPDAPSVKRRIFLRDPPAWSKTPFARLPAGPYAVDGPYGMALGLRLESGPGTITLHLKLKRSQAAQLRVQYRLYLATQNGLTKADVSMSCGGAKFDSVDDGKVVYEP